MTPSDEALTSRDLHALIKRRREALGRSVQHLANEAQISVHIAREWEKGTCLDGHAGFVRYLEALGVILIVRKRILSLLP